MLQPLQTSVDEPSGLVAEIELRLDELVPAPRAEGNPVSEAVRYSLLAPGKRLRPAMVVRTAESLGGVRGDALDPACAVEMVHTASLILDDLPCMDDAAVRRGRPSCHARYGVDTATLAAIALLNRAYFVLSGAAGADAATRTALVRVLARAVGECGGMVAGQMRDLAAGSDTTGLDDVRTLVTQKTAVLFVCAAETGARLAKADRTTIEAVREFATKFGLCFQALDDLADVEASLRSLGKDVRQDDGKATFATLLGPVAARRAAGELAAEAMAALDSIELTGSVLADLARDTFARAGLDPLEVTAC